MGEESHFCWYIDPIKYLFCFIGLVFFCKRFFKFLFVIFKTTFGSPTRALSTYKPATKRDEKPKCWAVVTGGSMGIGRADAEVLAKAGYNLVLLALEEDLLAKVKEEIEDEYSVSVETIPVNFVNIHSDEWAKLGARIAAFGDIAVLVNNAGLTVDPPGLLHEVDPAQLERIVAVNVSALTQLTRALVPALLEHKKNTGRRGLIVTMSSFNSRLPVPLLQVYSASKKYTQWFSMAIGVEYKNEIDVVSAAPWWVATSMTGIRHSNWRTMSADAFAKNVFKFVGKSRYEVDPYFFFALFDFALEFIPNMFVNKPIMSFLQVVRKAYFRRKERREKQAQEEANKSKKDN